MVNNLVNSVVGSIYIGADKRTILDNINTTSYQPLSNNNVLFVYLENAFGNSGVVTASFKSGTQRIPTTQPFFLRFIKDVSKVVGGEVTPRHFSKYILTIPQPVANLNLNKTEPLNIHTTINVSSSIKFIGTFNTLVDLTAHVGSVEKDIAYVIESGIYGYYEYVLDNGNLQWLRIENDDITRKVVFSQYGFFDIGIQGGYFSEVPHTNINDWQEYVIWQEINATNYNVVTNKNDIEDLQIDLGATKDRVEENENDIVDLKNRVSETEHDIDLIESDILDIKNDINELDGRVGVNETDIYNLESDVDDLETEIGNIKDGTTIVKKAEQDASGNVITSTYETKADATNKLATKVDKTTKVIGIDLQDDILLTEFKTALGNATQSVAGLLSAEDKTHLDGLVALLENSDGNTVVDTIGEILEIFQNYPEGADLVTALNGKVDKEVGKGLSTNDFTDIDKNKVDLSYTHSEIVDGSNPHNTKFVNIADTPTTRDGYGITDVYTKPETYTQLEINNLLDNLSAVKGLKSTLLTPTELSNGDTISTNLLTNNGAFVVFTSTNTSTEEIDSDTVPVSTIITGKKFVFFDNQEIVFTIGETNSTFETIEDVTLKINLLYLDSENVQAVGVEFDGSLTNYLENQENVQSAINKLDEELKATNDNKVDKVTGKGLSTEDYTTTEKNKLSGIEAGAEVNVQSDWKQEVNTADDYIKNKPAIPTKTSDLTNDSEFITTETDPIFTAWDKSTGISITKSQITDLIEATQSLSGLMSATDKQRLDVLHALLEEDTANNVVDSINEILEIFNNYPEGADLVSALANKVDKVEGKGLSTNDYTNTDKQNVEKIPTIEQDIADLENNKVDKVEGKGLSTEDYTTIEKNKLSELAFEIIDIRTWSTATKTLALSDKSKLIVCNYTDDQTLTIPTHTSVPFPTGTIITFSLISPYKVTFSGQSGVDLASIDDLVTLATRYAMVSLIKLGENSWQLVGVLE